MNTLPRNSDQHDVITDVNIPHRFNTTNIHTHGLHVSPLSRSDNIFLQIEPGETFDYLFDIPSTHPAGTFFFHPHNHGSVATQMFSGMAGGLIIEGDVDQVPQIAAARDLVYQINELNVDATGQVPPFTQAQFSINGVFPLNQRILTVNGEVEPILTVGEGEVVRLRVINATPRTTVPFQVQGHTLHLIAIDGITLPRLTSMQTVTIPPGGRADVLLMGGRPDTYAIIKGQFSTGATGGQVDGAKTIGNLTVIESSLSMDLPDFLPAPLVSIGDNEITGRRRLTWDMSQVPGQLPKFLIDGRQFDPDVVDQTVELGAVEEWRLVNMSPMEHPFHIHINPFQVVAVNDQPVTPFWADTVAIPGSGTLTVRSRFLDFVGTYVHHCHTLVHEDLGMMQIVRTI